MRIEIENSICISVIEFKGHDLCKKQPSTGLTDPLTVKSFIPCLGLYTSIFEEKRTSTDFFKDY